MARHTVIWQDAGLWPTRPADPDSPNGVYLDISRGALRSCTVNLKPYPAPRVGRFVVECSQCGYKVVITTAGRRDDPRSVRLPCKPTVH